VDLKNLAKVHFGEDRVMNAKGLEHIRNIVFNGISTFCISPFELVQVIDSEPAELDAALCAVATEVSAIMFFT
jgi:hypothetical protein